MSQLGPRDGGANSQAESLSSSSEFRTEGKMGAVGNKQRTAKRKSVHPTINRRGTSKSCRSGLECDHVKGATSIRVTCRFANYFLNLHVRASVRVRVDHDASTRVLACGFCSLCFCQLCVSLPRLILKTVLTFLSYSWTKVSNDAFNRSCLLNRVRSRQVRKTMKFSI